jgi:hypothetical protein
MLDEFLERLDRKRRVDREEELIAGDARYRDEVLERVERHLRVDVRIDGDQAVRPEQQRVPVRRGFGGRVAGDVAVGPGPVLDHHGPPQSFGKPLGNQPRGNVGRASRRDRDQDADRRLRVLGKGRPGKQHDQASDSQAQQMVHDGSSLEVL